MNQMGNDMRHAEMIDPRSGQFLVLMAVLLAATFLLVPCVVVTSVAVADALLTFGG